MASGRRLDIRAIVQEAGMSPRPEFYSGRGAITCDLNDKTLERVYNLVKREYGGEASTQFAQMVADIPRLSATEFLNTLYTLESRGWKWNKNFLGDGKGIDVGPDLGNGGREAVAIATIGSFLGGSSERDETDSIRGEFLRRHDLGNKCSRAMRDGWGYIL